MSSIIEHLVPFSQGLSLSLRRLLFGKVDSQKAPRFLVSPPVIGLQACTGYTKILCGLWVLGTPAITHNKYD